MSTHSTPKRFNLSERMFEAAAEAAVDVGILGRDQAQYARRQIDAVFTESLNAAGFDDLVGILRWILDAHYPPEIFDGSGGDPGPVFIARLREALAGLEKPSSS